MRRTIYNQDRATLNQESYSDGFLAGYECGASAAIEQISLNRDKDAPFTYEDYYDPERVPFDEEGEEWNSASKNTAYKIGYSDAFDRGYSDTLKSVRAAFKQIRGIELFEAEQES